MCREWDLYLDISFIVQIIIQGYKLSQPTKKVLASWSKYYGFEPMNEFSSAMDNVKNSMNEAKEKLIN